MTSPVSDDHGAGRAYQVPSWLDPIYTQTQRTIMGRVRTRRGHPFLKFHPKTKEFEGLGDQPRRIFSCRAASAKYEPEVMPVKRRRGRPRKEKPASCTKGTPVTPVEEPQRKKRGRPRKSSTPKDYLEEYMDTAKKCKPKPTSSGADAVGSGSEADCVSPHLCG
ncbi:hypothetical protein DY000_02014436 [Brassica cretica]|uniref:AT-hook motif nuclear-localized protein n=1 Tax=Brassica cretica TaxID=69181 RepID=A0ABQ7D121_BRACR|nr:hypothetical protein DY000_02014436 [Brassica cretica]